MNLKVLLPFEVFADVDAVARIVVETPSGAFGILPRRLDCVAAIAAGILTYETEADDEVFIAVDEGVMAKVGSEVTVSVRRAVAGKNLKELQKLVEEEFLIVDESERHVRSVMAKLEVGFMTRLRSMGHE